MLDLVSIDISQSHIIIRLITQAYFSASHDILLFHDSMIFYSLCMWPHNSTVSETEMDYNTAQLEIMWSLN